MKIGPFDLNSDVMVIAEIGNNHRGNFEEAVELIELAAQSGADAVKFQAIRPERLVHASQGERLAWLRDVCLPIPRFAELSRKAAEEDVIFLATPFDVDTLDELSQDLPAIKIASGDNNFHPLIARAIEHGKPLLISTGILDARELDDLMSYLCRQFGSTSLEAQVALLHCVCSYPTPNDEANLQAIRQLTGFSVTPGYSDHTVGNLASLAAVTLGARVIEKHFTRVHSETDTRDHLIAADPDELHDLVTQIRSLEKMLEHPGTFMSPCEKSARTVARRSAVTARDLSDGHQITPADLHWVRPGGGVPPDRIDLLVGRKLNRAVSQGETITADDVHDSSDH